MAKKRRSSVNVQNTLSMPSSLGNQTFKISDFPKELNHLCSLPGFHAFSKVSVDGNSVQILCLKDHHTRKFRKFRKSRIFKLPSRLPRRSDSVI